MLHFDRRPVDGARVPVLKGDIARLVTGHDERTGARPLSRSCCLGPNEAPLPSRRVPVRSSWPVTSRAMPSLSTGTVDRQAVGRNAASMVTLWCWGGSHEGFE